MKFILAIVYAVNGMFVVIPYAKLIFLTGTRRNIQDFPQYYEQQYKEYLGSRSKCCQVIST